MRIYTFTKQALLSLIAFVALSSIEVCAQVTIGTDKAPISGALLELKQSDASGSNSEKGLGMPRVPLTVEDKLYPMFLEVDGVTESTLYNTPAKKTAQNMAHIGLLVYNINEVDDLCPGLYIWNGDNWQALIPSNVEMISDIEGNTYPVRQFGTAGTWMLTNLRSTYNDIIPVGSFAEASSMNQDKNYLTLSKPEYGFLYNWYAATNDKPLTPIDEEDIDHPSVQGICPKGWKVPSNKDWKALVAEVEASPLLYSTNTDGAKAAYTMLSPIPAGNVTVTGGLSSSQCAGGGFDALCVGYHLGGMTDFPWDATFYTSSVRNVGGGRVISLNPHSGLVDFRNDMDTTYCAIRCKKQ